MVFAGRVAREGTAGNAGSPGPYARASYLARRVFHLVLPYPRYYGMIRTER